MTKEQADQIVNAVNKWQHRFKSRIVPLADGRQMVEIEDLRSGDVKMITNPMSDSAIQALIFMP